MSSSGSSLAKLGVRLPLYLLVIGLIIFFRYRSNSISETEAISDSGSAGIPKIGSDSPVTIGPAGDSKQNLENVDPDTDYLSRSIKNDSYPRTQFLAWDVELADDGMQTISVLIKFESNLKLLKWNELILKAATDGEDLAMPEAVPDQEGPVKGVSIVRFQLAKEIVVFKQGLIWCWGKPLCELKPDRRWPKEQLLKYLSEHKAGNSTKVNEEPAVKG